MKSAPLCLILALGLTPSLLPAANEDKLLPPTDADTSIVHNLETAIVVATPKEHTQLRNSPVSVSLAGGNELRWHGATSLKEAALLTPGFYVPKYGSRLTSAAYIRGVGSRIGTPAVGLYVDNLPVTDKTAYDFSFIDVDRVDVLRGPQSTLYGRGTMAGLVRIFTADPFAHRGTDISLGAATRGGTHAARFTTYLHAPSGRIAASIGGFYEGAQGFRRNVTSGRHADQSSAAGAKTRIAWLASDRLRMDLKLNYEYSDERACPYYVVSDTITHAPQGRITQNRQSTYRRHLASAGLNVVWEAPAFTLTSLTSYRYLNDRLFMDQDFLATDLFSLTQRQNMNTFTEEVLLKSKNTERWKHTTGLFGSYTRRRTTCPVNFYGDGMDFLNSQFASVFARVPHPMSLTIDNAGLDFFAAARMPELNAAVFHESTFSQLFGLNGLEFTLGLRLDYDRQSLRLRGGSNDVNYTFLMPSFRVESRMTAQPAIREKLHADTWQLLPRFALTYKWGRQDGAPNNIYASISKGYRSGGYNIQNYSDLASTQLRREMMLGVEQSVVDIMSQMPMPEATKQHAIAAMQDMLEPNIPAEPSARALRYDPERAWNYELGTHISLIDNHVFLDASVFYMHTRGLQIARFAEGGFGREQVNAGRSRSTGGEISLSATFLPKDRLFVRMGYGYARAVFTAYNLNASTTTGSTSDYTSNAVPFAPRHTFNATLRYREPIATKLLHALSFGVETYGAGRIYFDEANTLTRPLYATLGARIAAELKGNIEVALWGRNLTGTDYDTFRFVNLSRTLAQQGEPRCFGIDVQLHF